ncbi:fibronectin type III domain-containing protein [Tenacibaculum sp. S7007]|uniref:Fibronectin type III domain-containing protein n=1 Tax=Tenacibaculum pelagium TaxID=2759527 RepID=A0A839ANU7_9FLAO|nr:GEVED domain-containing protein [Tenacibaculum pelagium]MBA6156765.1 fibronectin type III domain-containing protein [Tenacibaculum pelagium]
MKSNFKFLIGGLSLVVASTIGYKEYQSFKEKKEIENRRQNHAEFLKNSPFKETLKWDKKTRKLNGLPPNRYFEQMAELTMNPATGELEQGNVTKLRQDLVNMRQSQRTPGDSNNAWEERGPNNVGGRTRVIMFDPNDATNNRVYAGGVSGGLWVNNDISNSNSQWQRVQNVPGNLSVTSITVDPRNSNTWYVGTGEQYTAGDVVGNGVYKTTDGGTTWTAVNIPAAGGGTINHNATNVFLSGIHYVNDVLAWDNGTSTELFVAVGAHVYGASSSPRNWLGLQSAGLYRSTDGGANWSRIETVGMRYDFNGNNYYYIPNDLEVGADNKIWMGTINSALGQGGGRVFSSTNGSTWAEAGASPLTESNRVEIEPSASDANKLYVLAQGTTTAAPVRIFKTTNGFSSVSTVSLPNDADTGIAANDFCRGQAFYDLVIEADPSNDNTVYVGGIDLFKTTNGGSSWSQLSHWYGGFGVSNNVHADQHSIAFGNNSSTKMLFGNDGGIYYSGNAGSSISVRNKGYNVTQFVKAGIGPDGSGDTNGIFSAGAQDNGTQAFRNASAGINSSTELSDGDGFYTFVDKDGQYMIATYVNNVIYRFSLPWNGQGRRQGGATTLSSDQNTGDFVNQMGYDSNANRLLTNKSTSSSNAIMSINVASNSNGTLTNSLLDAKPTAFRASPFTANRWFVGLANGKFLKLSSVGNSSATFASITTPFVGSISSVRFGATENDIFVTMHNYGVISVWATTDGGTNWVNKEGNLPNIPVRDFLQNPLDRNEAIVATQLGVWSTSNFNAATPTWSQSYNGMSDVSVTSLDYWNVNGTNTQNKIIASTYGRGVFTGTFIANTVADTQAPTVPGSLAVSNIEATTLTLNWNASTDNVGVSGYDVYQGTTKIGTPTTTSYNVTGLSASTAYTFTVKAKDAAGNESAASSAVNVTTKAVSMDCSSTVSSFPYNEGFESGIGAWTQDSSDNFDWSRDASGTPSSSTGPSAAAAGTYYMYTESSNPNYPTKTAIFNSPCFDLSGVDTPKMKFKYHMYGSSMGTLKLEVQEEGSSTWTSVWNKSGDQGNSWKDAEVSLAAKKVKVRFHLTTASSYRSDAAIDVITVESGAVVADTQAPTTPTSLVASSITQTTLTLNWSASTDNVGVTGYDVYQGATKLGTVATTGYNVSGLTAATAYTFSVKAKDAAGNESASSNTVNATTLSTALSYCASKGNRSSYEWIDNVELGGMTNATGDNGGYEDFTSKVATLTQGSSNQMIVSAGFRSTAYTEHWAVWIDFNQNGTFDSSEKVVSGSSSSANNLTATVAVPSGAVLGNTRMRVSMKYNAAQTACETFADGEVEDYTVNIVATSSAGFNISSIGNSNGEALGNERSLDLMAYPNPATNFVQVKLASKADNMTYKIVNTIGRVVQAGRLESSNINVTNLNSGIYILEVNDGQKSLTTKLMKK